MKQDTGDLTKRISFAEGWLARARQQVEAGHPERGVLTLVLAAAEVRLAREAGGLARLHSGRQAHLGRLAATTAALAAAALVFTLAVALSPAVPVDVGIGQAPPVVVLSGGKGALAGLVTDPQPAAVRTVTRTVVVHVPVKVTGGGPPQAAPVAVRPAVQHAPERVAAAPVAPVAAAGIAPTQHVLLSEADVIELVLAAERALRRASNQ